MSRVLTTGQASIRLGFIRRELVDLAAEIDAEVRDLSKYALRWSVAHALVLAACDVLERAGNVLDGEG